MGKSDKIIYFDSRIKDLRTQHETGNIQAVLNGDIDQFIEESIKKGF